MSEPVSNLPRTQAWLEEVAYWECPRCCASNELGSGIIFSSDDIEETCRFCGQDALVEAPTEGAR